MFSKLTVVAFLSLALGLSSRAQNSSPAFEESDVFVGGQNHIHTYRIPSLICTKKGTLLAFSEGRRNGSGDGISTDIVLKRSLGGRSHANSVGEGSRGSSATPYTSWLPMQTLIRSEHGEAYMNPVPLVDQADGTIYLLVNYYPPPYADLPAEIWVLTSKDEGATWSGPANITAGTGKHELGPGDGIQLQSGILMAPVYDGVVFSDDHGKTWKSGGKAPGEVSETQIMELRDGTLLFSRRNPGYRLMMTSIDGGQTWSPPKQDPGLPDPDCQGAMIRYTREDHEYAKNRILFSNPVAGLDPKTIQTSDPRGRINITVRLSYDEGKTWPVAKLIKRGPGAYSSMTVLPDGSIGMLFETGRYHDGYGDPYQKLMFARFNLEWLTDGKDHLEKK